MPIKKSAFKALRQTKKRTSLNTKIQSDIVALVRRVRKAITAKDSAKASDWLKQAIKKIDKASARGILKKNTAARKKSRLVKAVSKIGK